MKFNNVHQILSTNLTNTHKCLEKILFSRRSESKKNPEKKKIQFGAKKVFFLSICGCWSNWWKKFGVHCWTSCKIRTPTDKYCGNESKIRLTHKIHRFMPIFLPPGFLTEKHVNFGHPFWPFLEIFQHFLTIRSMIEPKKQVPFNLVEKYMQEKM